MANDQPAARPSSYKVSYAAAVALAVLGYVLTAVIGAATIYGFDIKVVTTLGILLGAIGIVKDFMPRINKPPSDGRAGLD